MPNSSAGNADSLFLGVSYSSAGEAVSIFVGVPYVSAGGLVSLFIEVSHFAGNAFGIFARNAGQSYLYSRGVLIVTVINVGYEISDLSSNHRSGCLCNKLVTLGTG